MNNKILTLTYSGLMAAITFIGTSVLAFPVAFTNGYIHLGDGFVLSCGVILGKRNGALAAGIGSAFADIYLGYASWALPTFIIKALMAYFVGYVFEAIEDKRNIHRVTAMLSLLWLGFIAVTSLILSNNNNVMRSKDTLITEEIISTASEISSRTAFTLHALSIGALILPLLYLMILFVCRKFPNKTTRLFQGIGFLTSGTLMIILYYLTYGLMYGNWTVPIFSIPSNLLQYALGIAVSMVLLPLTLRFRTTLANAA